jgi:hypothetical protein
MFNVKCDKIEYEKRIRMVQEWILEDWPSCDIIDQIFIKWGIEERQAKRYLAEARKRWAINDTELIKQRKRIAIERLKKMKRSLKEEYRGTPDGIKAALLVEKQIEMLEGLEKDKVNKLEITGKDGNPIVVEKQVIIVNGMEISF